MPIPLSSDFSQNSGLPISVWDTVADITARDAIPAFNRFDGLVTYVISTNETWQLQGGITNADWVLITNTGGSSDIEIGITEVLSGTPNSILYIAPDGTLGQDNPNFTYDEDEKIMTLKDNVTLALGNGGLSGDLGADMHIYSDGTVVTFKIESPTGILDSTNPYLSFQYHDLIGVGVYVPFIYFGRNAGFGGGLDGVGGFAHTIYVQDIYNQATDGAFLVPDKTYPSILKYAEFTYQSSTSTVRIFHSDALNQPFAIDGSGHYSFGSLSDLGARVNVYPTGTSMGGIYASMPSSYGADIFRMEDSTSVARARIFKPSGAINDEPIVYTAGLLSPSINAILGFIDATGFIATGTNPVNLIICDDVSNPGGSLVMGNDRSTQTLTNDTLMHLTVISDDDSGGFGLVTSFAIQAPDDWTSTSTPTKIYIATAPIGSTAGVGHIQIDHDGTIYLNDSGGSTGNVLIKNSFSSSALFADVGQSRVGINKSYPDFTLDVEGDIRVPENAFIYMGNIGSTPSIRLEGYDLGKTFIIRSLNGTYNHWISFGLDQTSIVISIAPDDPDYFINFLCRIAVLPNVDDAPGSVLFPSGTHLSFPYNQSHVTPGEHILQQEDFPPMYKSVGDAICCSAFGTFGNDDATKRLRMYFGSTLIYDSGDVIQNDGTWSLEMEVNCLSDSSQQICVRYLSNGTLIGSGAIYTVGSEDLTNDVNIRVTSECDNTGGIHIHSFRIKFYPYN